MSSSINTNSIPKPNRRKNSLDENDYMPKRFGISYNPPQIVVEYQKLSNNKLYHHKIKLHKFSSKTKISEIIDYMYKRHNIYLNHKKVNKAQIIQLVEKLRGKLNQTNENDEKNKNDVKLVYNIKDENLNKLSKEELDQKKKEMDVFYEQNNIKKTDKNFQYDIRKEFNNDEVLSDWDDDEEDEEI